MSHFKTSFGDSLRCDSCQVVEYSEGLLSAFDIAERCGWQVGWQGDDRDLCPDCRRRFRAVGTP